MSSIKIRAAVTREAGGSWQIEEFELEEPRPDEVLVRMVATGVCHTDIICQAGIVPVPMPIVLGHEGAGVIEALGSEVTGIQLGDHVILSFDACGTCRNCQRHRPAYCHEFFPRNFSGARPDRSTPLSFRCEPVGAVFFGQSSFATHAVVRAADVVVIGKDLPLELMGPLACGIQTGAGAAVRSLGVGQDDSYAIFGGGAVGLSSLLGAKIMGAGPVIVIEPNVARRQLALELGADHAIDPLALADVAAEIRQFCSGVDFAFDTTGILSVIATAMQVLAPGGTLGMVGAAAPGAMLPTPLLDMVGRGLGVKYIIEGDSDPQSFIPEMLEWYRVGKFPFDRLIKFFPFDAINEAAASAERGETIKPVLVF